MKDFLVSGVSISEYTILSESMEDVNITRSKAKISDQALANHTPPLDTTRQRKYTTAANQKTATSSQRMQTKGTHGMAADDVSNDVTDLLDQHGGRKYTVKPGYFYGHLSVTKK